jgi:hypothetical protein
MKKTLDPGGDKGRDEGVLHANGVLVYQPKAFTSNPPHRLNGHYAK